MLFKLAGDLGLELFEPFTYSPQSLARIAHSSLMSLAVLTADRDLGGIDQLARILVTSIVIDPGQASQRERTKRLRGGVLTQEYSHG